MPHRWNDAAPIRRQQIESGSDLTFTRVFVPYFQGLVNGASPSSLLEIGCGTGHLVRSLAGLVPKAVAIEPSTGMHRVAAEVLRDTGVHLHHTRLEEFACAERFDLVISHLCVQVTKPLQGFLSAAYMLVTPKGSFVFTIPHPCFWNRYQEYIPKKDFAYMKTKEVKAKLTITKDRTRVIAEIPYIHRPISDYFAAIAQASLYVAAFEEILPPPEIQDLYGERWTEPRFVAFHCRAQR